MYRLKKNLVPDPGKELNTLVLVSLSPSARRDPQMTANKLTKYKEIESIGILAGNWDLALEVKTENQEELYDFLMKIISKEAEIAKTNSLISLKWIRPYMSLAHIDVGKR